MQRKIFTHWKKKITVKKAQTTVDYAILTACFTPHTLCFSEAQQWIFVSLGVNTSQYSVFFVYSGKNCKAPDSARMISVLKCQPADFQWTIFVASDGREKTLGVAFEQHPQVCRQQCFLAMACHKTKRVWKFCSQNLNSKLILSKPFTESSCQCNFLWEC